MKVLSGSSAGMTRANVVAATARSTRPPELTLWREGPEKRPVPEHETHVDRQALEALVDGAAGLRAGAPRRRHVTSRESRGVPSGSSWQRRETSSIRVIEFAG